MSKMVKLTDADGDQPFWLNPDHVLSIRAASQRGKTRIMLAAGNSITVDGAPETVAEAFAAPSTDG
jgi:uncharacterized protein YlzI (FlbEa/FlbD family)